MPIKDLSDSVRMPRLGKIHLGIRHPEKGYPMKVDYFVLPKDHPSYGKLVELFGEKPKELRILIPVEDAEEWATQYYKAYNQTFGLVCKGDGETAFRMSDSKTGELPKANVPGTVTMKEIPCAGIGCPEYQAKKCHEVMNFKFIIPEVPGLGVWQIDTGSKNSILNINSCAKIIKKAFGRISMIPLTLTFEPVQVNNPETGKKQTVYVLNLRTDVTMAQLAEQAREQSRMFLLEAPDLEAVLEEEVKQDIETLWGDLGQKPTGEVIESTAEEVKPEEQAKAKEPVGSKIEKAESQAVAEKVDKDILAEEQPALLVEPAEKDETPIGTEQLTHITQMMKDAGMDLAAIGKYCNVDKGWNIRKLGDLVNWQYSELVEAFAKGKA